MEAHWSRQFTMTDVYYYDSENYDLQQTHIYEPYFDKYVRK